MSNDNKSRIVGIDLGTTNSCISIVHNKTPKIIENNEGYRTTPSVVSIFKDKIVVGENAKKNLTTYPKNTIFASKRLIGRKYDDLDIKSYLRALPYDTVKHCNGDIWIKIDGKTYSPAQIGAFVLTKLKLAAEKVLNSKVVKSVITVPAYFNDIQRQATKDAGKIAGLDVLRVINEPTAAALAYGLDKSAQGTIVVYDLGGGTFDVSVLKLDDGIFHVLATNGNTFLGGEDVDNKLVDYILQKFQSKTGIDIGNEKASVNRIKEAVEKLKKELSCNLEAQINLPYICHVHGKNWHLEELVTRDEFEKICRPIIEKTKEPCLRALKDAKVNKTDVKHVILVGGMTRIPYVRKVVRDVFGCEPMTDVNPDEVVAKGAALQAAVLEGQIDNVILLDVVPISLGIELLGGVYNKIINRNTTVPFKETHTFSTSEDNQTEVDIRVYQGENKMVNDNKLLGSIKLTNIPKAPKGVPRIEVTFEADVNGIYKVSACDAVTKEKQEISIVPSSGLNKEEIEHMANEAKENEQRDKKLQQETEYKIKIKEMLNKNVYSSLINDKLKNIIQEPFDLKKAKSCLNEIEKKIGIC